MFKNLNPSAIGVSGHQSELIELALTYGFAGMDLNVAEFATRVRLKGMPYARRLIDSAKIRIGTFCAAAGMGDRRRDVSEGVEKAVGVCRLRGRSWAARAATAVLAAGRRRPPVSRELRVPPPPLPRHLRRIEAGRNPAGHRLSGGRVSPPQPGLPVHPRSRRLDAAVEHGGGAEPGLAAGHLGRRGLRRIGGLDPQASGAADRRRAGGRHAGRRADLPSWTKNPVCCPAARMGGSTWRGSWPCCGRRATTGRSRVKPSRGAFQSRRRDVVIKQTSEALDKVLRPSAPPPAARPVLAAV